MSTEKPFNIPKQLVFEAYSRVRKGGKSPGVDNQTLAAFDKDLKKNLYRIWNRMSSMSYFPPPVKRVEIPKTPGGTRPLGIPTLSDRIAQMVVKLAFEPLVEPHFHKDSYGYRPGKSALDAVRQARRRCWTFGWVVDLDIKASLTILITNSCSRLCTTIHRLPGTDCTSSGGLRHLWLLGALFFMEAIWVHPKVESSVRFANLYLRYAFDLWMGRVFPEIVFERYADDIVVHARNQQEAIQLRQAISDRLQECKLELHPEKTKIVLCKQWNRPEEWPSVNFDFLGYCFRPREAFNRNKELFTVFMPAVSKKALQRMRRDIRHWHMRSFCHLGIEEISTKYSAKISGWIQYYGSYYKRELFSLFNTVDTAIAQWACTKYRRFHGRLKQARAWVARLAKREPKLFPHWAAKASIAVGQ